MKKGLILSFFILGLTSIIAQVVLLRELTISFYGNEFFIGIVLTFWMVWVAIGSGILGKTLNRFKRDQIFLIIFHFLVAFFLFLEIFLTRFLKNLIAQPGEIPNLIYAFIFAIFIPAPICLVLGTWWTVATRISAEINRNKEARAINWAYLLEVLGFILGGILFSFLLFQFQEFLIATVLIFLNLAVVFFIIFPKKGYFLSKTVAVLLIFIFLILSPQLDKLNKITAGFRFKNQQLLESTNSQYGNIAVTRIGNQNNFYESGLLLGSDKETIFSEYLIHLSLLQHPSPKKILLIGGGFNRSLNEILKHPVEKVYYLELDAKLIEISEEYILKEFKEVLSNQKLEIINIDGRYFLNKTEEKFDFIIINLPDPSTVLLNRFYTKEFFEKAKEKLNDNGIVSTYLTFTPSTPAKNLENLNASLYKTLKSVFSQVIILPEDTNFFLATENENLTYQPESLIQRFKERKIETEFLTENYINYRLTDDRVNQALDLFEKNKEAKENQDFKPISYFYQTLFWLEHFYFKFANSFKAFSLAFWQILAGALIILTIFLFKQRKNTKKVFPIFSMAVASLSLMALEIIIIFSYQIFIGYLYFRLALLISALMTGIALGVWYGNKKRNIEISSLLKFHSLLIVFSAIFSVILLFLARVPSISLLEVIFLVLAIGAGFLEGVIFTLANKIYLSQQREPNKKTGIIYTADLIGAALGSVLPALIVIPVFGVLQCLLFIVIMNFWIILNLLFLKDLGSENI